MINDLLSLQRSCSLSSSSASLSLYHSTLSLFLLPPSHHLTGSQACRLPQHLLSTHCCSRSPSAALHFCAAHAVLFGASLSRLFAYILYYLCCLCFHLSSPLLFLSALCCCLCFAHLHTLKRVAWRGMAEGGGSDNVNLPAAAQTPFPPACIILLPNIASLLLITAGPSQYGGSLQWRRFAPPGNKHGRAAKQKEQNNDGLASVSTPSEKRSFSLWRRGGRRARASRRRGSGAPRAALFASSSYQ